MTTDKRTPTPEEILKMIGAQIVLGEWRFPFYGKDTVAEMLPLDEWIDRRRKIGNSYDRSQEVIAEMRSALEEIFALQWQEDRSNAGPVDATPKEKGLLEYVGKTFDIARAALAKATALQEKGEK